MRLDEYARYDAVGLMQLLRSGQVGADELKRCATAAIERLNPQLNFMAGEVCEDEACQPGGPFYGLPFLLKEGLGWRGGAAAMGSRLANGIKVTTESEITRRLRRAGVRILGETAAPELGIYPVTESGRHGATRNPWNLA
ncbi:MAG: amidase family protein, partial [Nevskia sp.]|nr:amidase family protein [Nevskia sp.]